MCNDAIYFGNSRFIPIPLDKKISGTAERSARACLYMCVGEKDHPTDDKEKVKQNNE